MLGHVCAGVPAVALSGVSRHRVPGSSQFLLALLRVVSAAAGELGLLVHLLLSGRAAFKAVESGGLRRVWRVGLGLARTGAHCGGLGVETKPPAGGGGGRGGGRLEVR